MARPSHTSTTASISTTTTTTTTTDLPEVLPPLADAAEIQRLLRKYPLPAAVEKQHCTSTTPYAYGTAGFRFDAAVLPPIMVRVGLAAALQSMQKQKQGVGVMITASHNGESYNGVKLADPDGGMMDAAGERVTVQLVNEVDTNTVLETVRQAQRDCAAYPSRPTPVVHIGRDTRAHSAALQCLVSKAARAAGCTVVLHGVVTTPQLHFAVLQAHPHHLPPLIPSVQAGVMGYRDLLTHSYLALVQTANQQLQQQQQYDPPLPPLIVDCACGVGYPHLQALVSKLTAISVNMRTTIVATNGPGAGPLNEQCGSEHVQKTLQAPVWYAPEDLPASRSYCAALDGDADRIVFFFTTTSNTTTTNNHTTNNHTTNNNTTNNNTAPTLTLLDGDKIACLLCTFLQNQLAVLQQHCASQMEDSAELPACISLGVVQTAYANGAATAHLVNVLGRDNVKFAKTGVKYVHAAAHEFDIGVYFEANGHGTILFGPNFYKYMALVAASVQGHHSAANTAWQRLKVLPVLVNQAVGDALSDLLLVDAILQIQGWNLEDWSNMYTDLPSRQCKVQVADRSNVKVSANETECLEPAGVQAALDTAMQAVQGRAFVRPSGTEDVVRVYAEAPSRAVADELAAKAADIVFRMCGGVGKPPVFPASRM